MPENDLKQAHDEDKETSGDQQSGGQFGLDRDEGQTNNGVIGGTGSDLDKATERLGGATVKEESKK